MALVVITINAVNFVDGLDGLASGMVCIAAAAFFLYAYRIWYSYGIEAAAPGTLFAAILMGMCLGFLPHNMHPARIFMGDSGSMLIGLVLAAGAISITGRSTRTRMKLFAGSEQAAVHQTVPVYIPLLLPLTIIAIPAADLVLAIVRRTWRGQSPFAADRGHLHHRLLEIGHSHSRAVLIMYFWSALIAFGARRLLGQLGVHVDRPGVVVAQRRRPGAAAAAALHAARPALGRGLRAAALPPPPAGRPRRRRRRTAAPRGRTEEAAASAGSGGRRSRGRQRRDRRSGSRSRRRTGARPGRSR